jgi:hypothetical protein
MLLGGDPTGAIPVIRKAIDATGKSTGDCVKPSGVCLTYAYALFDLGQAYRKAGKRDQAVSTLEDRLRIDNQRGTVQRELDLAKKS